MSNVPSPSESAISLVSQLTEDPASSTTNLIPKAKNAGAPVGSSSHQSSPVSTPTRKDYEAAFAAMSSTMGFMGGVPTPAYSKKAKKDAKDKKSTAKTGSSPSTSSDPSAPSTK